MKKTILILSALLITCTVMARPNAGIALATDIVNLVHYAIGPRVVVAPSAAPVIVNPTCVTPSGIPAYAVPQVIPYNPAPVPVVVTSPPPPVYYNSYPNYYYGGYYYGRPYYGGRYYAPPPPPRHHGGHGPHHGGGYHGGGRGHRR